MSFAEGFVTGFANTVSKDINQRLDDANDYFQKQVEYARTKGLANRNQVKQAVDQNTSLARQLQQVGVPTNVIMGQINQDPEGLSSFYDQVSSLNAKTGRNLSSQEWAAIYEIGGDFKAPDEDITTFISRTYDPIANAINSDSFADAPKESLIASMMGFNAMDRARTKLGETEIAEGLTAEQLIRYGDVTPQRIGGTATVTTKVENVPTKPREVSDEGRVLRTGDFNFILDRVNKEIAGAREKLGGKLKEGDDISDVRDTLVTRMTEYYPDADPEQLKIIIENAITERRYTFNNGGEAPTMPEEVTTTVLPSDTPEVVDAPVEPPVEPPVEAPVDAPTPADGEEGDMSRPIDDREEPNLVYIRLPNREGKTLNWTLVRDNGDGTSHYMSEEGVEMDLDNALLRQMKSL